MPQYPTAFWGLTPFIILRHISRVSPSLRKYFEIYGSFRKLVHLPVFLVTKQQIKKKLPSISSRSITAPKLENFRQELIHISWNDILTEDNVNIAVSTFIEKFKQIYYHNFPRITYRPSKKIRKLWITRDLLHKMNEKNVMYNTFLACSDPQLFSTFKNFVIT